MLEANRWVDHASGFDVVQIEAMREARVSLDDSLQRRVVMVATRAIQPVVLNHRARN